MFEPQFFKISLLLAVKTCFELCYLSSLGSQRTFLRNYFFFSVFLSLMFCCLSFVKVVVLDEKVMYFVPI